MPRSSVVRENGGWTILGELISIAKEAGELL